MGGDQGDLELIAQILGGGHLLAGRERAGVDRLADAVLGGEVKGFTGLRLHGLEILGHGHSNTPSDG